MNMLRYIAPALLAAALLVLGADRLAAQDLPAEPFDEAEFEMGKRAREHYLEQLRLHGITATTIRDEWAARQQRQEKLRAGRPASSGAAWEYLGPLNQSGRITGIAISGADPNIWYCAADGGGIWKSTNGGGTWTPLTDTLPTLRMSTLAIAPGDHDMVLGGTHEGMVLRSTDGGARWSVSVPEISSYVYDIQFHPTDPQSALMGTDAGLYRSTDAGATWTRTVIGRVPMVEYNPADPRIVLVGLHKYDDTARIMRSTDGGETWRPTHRQRAANWGATGVRTCASAPSVAYAVVESGSVFYRSSDGGLTWTVLPSQPMRNSYDRGFSVFEVDPIDSNVVFAGTTTMFRTTNGGQTWDGDSLVNEDLHVDQHGMVFPSSMPGQFVATGDGGVFITSNYRSSKVTWRSRNRDLATLQIYNCAMHPKKSDTIIVGCQDNGYDKFSGDPYRWLIVGGDGFCTLYDRDEPGYFYHEYIYQNLHRADNGFTWWSAKKMKGLATDNTDGGFYTGIELPEYADWFGQAIAMSPADPKTLYMGTNYLYRTRDRAENWERVSDEQCAVTRGDYATAVAVASSRPGRVYIGTQNGGMYRVDDEAVVGWANIRPASGASGGRIRTFAVSSANADELWAGGDGGYDGRGVRYSTDGGTTWSTRSAGLPRAGVNHLLIDPDDPSTIYCGTTVGLYYTRNGGLGWHQMPDLPNVEIWDIAFDAPTRTLLLGTYGRGAIRARAFQPPDAPAAAPGSPEKESAALAVTSYAGDLRVRLTTATAGPVALTLYDALGRTVLVIHGGPLPAGEHEFAVGAAAAAGIAPGVYFVEARGALRQTARCVIAR